MEDIIRHQDQFYILASSPRLDARTRVLKEGDTFAVFDRYGDIQPVGIGEQGLFHEGTRYLSRLDLRLGRRRPLLLSSTIKMDNALLLVDLANPDFSEDGSITVARNCIHVFRSCFLYTGACYLRLRVRNFSMHLANLALTLQYAADFADIFEVRGSTREKRGTMRAPEVDGTSVVLAYQGLDGLTRCTRLECTPHPAELSGVEATFRASLQPGAEETYTVTVTCEQEYQKRTVPSHDEALSRINSQPRLIGRSAKDITTSNPRFNDWITRSNMDLGMMLTPVDGSVYPYAGVPWFSTVFGRDGIITALEVLWFTPRVARGVLTHLAATQATEVVDAQEAEPGKIVHETRKGEMAALGEIPFGRYYGSIDATPLFVMLAGAYHLRTGDLPLIQQLWPNILRALEWMDRFGDRDGDGFIEYARRSPRGLVQQGWKDSNDSVFHADGQLADGPIALCEVQAYAFEAKRQAAQLANALGYLDHADRLHREADTLAGRFQQTFWLPEMGTFALALDGRKEPCRVRTSNAGHCLFTGIASRDQATQVAHTLMEDDSFSGWGVRTVSAHEVRYNPMSYHNGSVWPHDNALIAAGLARYQHHDAVVQIMEGLFEAGLAMELQRLPELFCGFKRRTGEGPTLYPVACAPQAWASAAVFSLLQSCLGLSIQASPPRVVFDHPRLPAFLPELELTGLTVGDAAVDLRLALFRDDVAINVTHREGPVEIVAIK